MWGSSEGRDYEIKQKGTQQNNVKAFYNIPHKTNRRGEINADKGTTHLQKHTHTDT